MYEAILFVHNLVRWAVLAFGLLALWRFRAREGAFFAHTLTLQVVLGILLAFVSPLFQGALANLEATMQTPGEARYFVAEHWVGGLIALGLAHAGLSQARKGRPQARIFFALALALLILSIPWFRPLLRL